MFTYLKNILKFLNKKISLTIYKLLILLFVFIIIGAIYHRLQLFPLSMLKNVYYKLKDEYPQTFGTLLYRIEEIRDNPIYVSHNNRAKFVKIYNYKNGINIWSDRLYYDQSLNTEMDGLILIQIPRHHDELIRINTNEPLTVYRPLCSNNDNNYYVNWFNEDIEMRIIGKSCVNHKVVSNKYDDSTIILPPGGPFASDPIFIKPSSYNQKIEINN